MAVTDGSGASCVTIPHERSSVGTARHAIADELETKDVPALVLQDAVLVVSELVSNAIKHADPLPSGEILVRWCLEADRLRLEITDGGAMTRPRAGTPGSAAMGGRGLDIVSTVCSDWGVTEHENSVTVWADLPRSGRAG